MKTIKTFFSFEEKEYYYIGQEPCTKCQKPLFNLNDFPAFLLWDYYRGHLKELIYCMRCKSEITKAGGKYSEFKQVQLSSIRELPLDAVAVFPEAPTLSTFRGSVFEVANDLKDGSQVVDHTKLAGRESPEGERIGKDISEEIKELEAPLEDIDAALSFHKEAPLAIPE